MRLTLPALLCLILFLDLSISPGDEPLPPPATPPASLPQNFGRPADLPRPSEMSVNAFEEHLFAFVNQRRYRELGWLQDKSVRDTGPYVSGKYYGTHPAVRIFYSPEIIEWLVAGRQGRIPDGAMMIKEQFKPPAARHEGLSEEQLWEALESWTIMIKDSRGSHDGWFWSNPAKDQKVVNYYEYPFEEPYSGFGLYCVRCHASTQSPGPVNEFTFASLRNIQGFPGQPLLFRVDNSWRVQQPPEDHSNEALVAAAVAPKPTTAAGLAKASASHPRCAESDNPSLCIPELNEDFVRHFPQVGQCDRADLLHFPPVTYDSIPRQPLSEREHHPDGDSQLFVTSNQCMGCHAGITEPFGPTMFIPTADTAGYGDPGIHVSPYGEWRWTPMGLAGRDPVFFAQLESEIALLRQEMSAEQADALGQQLVHTCLGCHGAMGQRQHEFDSPNGSHDLLSIDDVYRHENDPQAKEFRDSHYGSLARDGVSCAVCHRMQPRPQPAGDTRSYLEHFLNTSITGNFYLGKPGEIYGPFKDDELAPYIMEHGVGFKPKHSNYIQQSQMCGTCHTVSLPIVDWAKQPNEPHDELMLAEANPAFRDFHHHVEQATYLEWLNSEYENEFQPDNPLAKSCQDCHMSRGLVHADSGIQLEILSTQIASVQDHTYPDAENLAAHADLKVRHREQGFARHNFRGLNAFLIEMFNQFDDVLGVRKHDYMTGSKLDIQHALDDFVRQAAQETVKLDLASRWSNEGQLLIDVDLHSLVGHRFPSGVGFRRAFVELLVIDESQSSQPATSATVDGKIVWSSGRTDEAGVIVDNEGRPLATEFLQPDAEGRQQYQPHHAEITSSSQVQIYETLLHDQAGRFTTSFIHGCTVVKDNRFLPRGWSRQGPGSALNGEFLSATYPGPVASQDPRYQDGSGSDQVRYRVNLPNIASPERLRVQATLYYQALPPYFLKNIFDTTPNSPAARRLHAICSNLKHKGTAIEDWKLKVVSSSTRPAPQNRGPGKPE